MGSELQMPDIQPKPCMMSQELGRIIPNPPKDPFLAVEYATNCPDAFRYICQSSRHLLSPPFTRANAPDTNPLSNA